MKPPDEILIALTIAMCAAWVFIGALGLVEMVRGWLAAADNWGRFTNLAIGSEPGEDGMFEEWKAMGESIRALLRKYGELAELAEVMGEPRFRLNLPTLDRMVVAAMEWQELESGATPS